MEETNYNRDSGVPVIYVVSGNGKGAGKTTLASKLGDQTLSFASGVRAEVARMLPDYNWYSKDQVYKDTVKVKEWGNLTIRECLIEKAEYVCQEDPAYWAKALRDHLLRLTKIANGVRSVAIDDLRKRVELEVLKDAFGDRVIHFHIEYIADGMAPEYDYEWLSENADYTVVR